MFRSVRIQNFRQFRDLKLDGLAPINLITGQNNTGKTSLLEALFLLVYPEDPSRTLTLANLRGVRQLGPETPELWQWLFTDQDLSRAISITALEPSTEPDGTVRSTRLEVTLSRESRIPVAGTNSGDPTVSRGDAYLTATEPLPELSFNFVGSSGETLATTLRWSSEGLILEPDRRLTHQAAKRGFFLSDAHSPTEQDADRLSRLIEYGREAPLIEGLRIVEPRLRALTVLTHGGRPSVYADLGRYPLVPLALSGKGFSRLLTILSALTIVDGTTVLIDELENGFHYSKLSSVWGAIISVALKHSAQLLVTTHSYECIQAAVEASKERPRTLAMFRLERADDRIRAVNADDEELRAAVGLGFEMR